MENTGENTGQPHENQSKLPGGATKVRPISIGGEFYDPFHPPKLYRNPNGTEEYRGGRKLDKDDVYADRFWEKNKVEGLREAMVENIRRAIKVGYFGQFVSPNGIDEKDRENLSAYRKLARELGYEMGPYTFDANTYIAKAALRKSPK